MNKEKNAVTKKQIGHENYNQDFKQSYSLYPLFLFYYVISKLLQVTLSTDDDDSALFLLYITVLMS